jgi:hypothetical protein
MRPVLPPLLRVPATSGVKTAKRAAADAAKHDAATTHRARGSKRRRRTYQAQETQSNGGSKPGKYPCLGPENLSRK